jgi:protein-L-isoaspartate(D-aspartate) O-methyltransferase
MPRKLAWLRSVLSRKWLLLALLSSIVSGAGSWLGAAAGPEEDRYRQLRLKMVDEQIAREGIRNPTVLKAMREVPRHLFVNSEQRSKAYYDQILSIGHKQTLSPGYIVAYETEAIDPKPSDRVLEIGTGSGYQAAILSRIVKEVYTIEIIEELGKEARARLNELGYTNIKTKIGDGYKGWPEFEPFDKILVTCSPEDVPQPLIDQLKEGGKMIIPLGERFQQTFYLFEKQQGKLVKQRLLPTLFVPMTGQADKDRKTHYDGEHPKIVNGDFESSTDGIADGWYYQRQATLEHTGAPEGKTYITFANSDPGRSAQALQAFGVDGSKVEKLRISLWVKTVRVVPQLIEQPFLFVFFVDADNRAVGPDPERIGPWLGSIPWQRFKSDLRVPPQAHMAVMLIGLNGATGSMSVDDVTIKAIPR